jgi:ATP-dependent protease ClpP protease subunit
MAIDTFGLHDNDLNLKWNHIYLFPTETRASGNEDPDPNPGVDFTMANRFIRNLMTCQNENPNKDIVLHMKTGGGYWDEGMAIYDAIRACPVHITILNYSTARSMSSLIFLAANKRVMMPHATFMFHRGTLGFSGTVSSAFSFVDFEKLTQEQMLNIYTKALKEQGKYKNKSTANIKEMLKFQMDRKEEVYLSAKDAVSWGFADAIFDGNWKKLTKYTRLQMDRG